MKRVFTQRFFRLSACDQAAIVDAALRDLDDAQCWASEKDRKRAKQIRQTIIGKAVKYGVFAGGQSDGGKK